MITDKQAIDVNNTAREILKNTIPNCIILMLCLSNITNISTVLAVSILIIIYFYIKHGIKNKKNDFAMNFRPIWFIATIIFLAFSYLYQKSIVSYDAYLSSFFIITGFPMQFFILYHIKIITRNGL